MAAKFFYQDNTLVNVIASERASRYVRTKEVILSDRSGDVFPASLLACELGGTVGGAVYMNAGAYGGEIKDVLTAVTFLDENLHLQTLPVQELQLGYRTSIFERCSWCILEAEFTLHPGDAQEIHTAMQEYMRRRKEKQPLEYPSAGSTFKRPVGQFAGKLIEDCGLRGFRVGGAAISEKHCGFVVNLGNATCADVVSLTEQVRQIVLEKTGCTLEREIRVVE